MFYEFRMDYVVIRFGMDPLATSIRKAFPMLMK